MDQIFDRLNTLFKSFIAGDESENERISAPRDSGNSDFDDAMAELNAFLNDDREAQDRLHREQEARNRQNNRAEPKWSEGPPPKLLAAYRVLGVRYGSTLPEIKKAWKDLLKEHHPDKHAADPIAYNKATTDCSRINDAFRIVETWHEKGHLGDE
jgi:hypothetical protein